jgi:hypothetical protein
VGTFVGGVTTLVGGGLIERGKFARERNAREADRKRDYNAEALSRSQAALLTYEKLAFLACLRRAAGVHPPTMDQADEAHAAWSEVMVWTNRIQDPAIRARCDDAARACDDFGARGGTPETWHGDVAPRYSAAQEALSEAVRALYD